MRQAGRYMHEYQALRSNNSFLDLCYNPELVALVTEMPIRAFGFDAAIVFSDILLITQYLGMNLRFDDNVGPVIDPPLCLSSDIQKLIRRGPLFFEFLAKACRFLKSSLKVPLIGFAGAPFTVASYMIEGKSSRDLRKTKRWILEDPQSFTELIDLLVEATFDLLSLQIQAGVDALQIFDSWAMHLPVEQFEAFVAQPLEKILKRLNGFPVILFCRSPFIERLARLRPLGLSIDWSVDMREMRQKHPHLCLQGNLDPDVLLTCPNIIERHAKELLDKMQGDPAFIFNLGHGVLKETPRENIEALVSCVKS